MSASYAVHHITAAEGKLLFSGSTEEDALRAVAPLIKKLTRDGEDWHKYDDPTCLHAWRSTEWHYILIKVMS